MYRAQRPSPFTGLSAARRRRDDVAADSQKTALGLRFSSIFHNTAFRKAKIVIPETPMHATPVPVTPPHVLLHHTATPGPGSVKAEIVDDFADLAGLAWEEMDEESPARPRPQLLVPDTVLAPHVPLIAC